MMTVVVGSSGTPAVRPAVCAGTGLEVVTVESDTLRAMIRVDGALTAHTASLLISVIGTHVRAGRRYLRVDLAGASVEGVEVTESLAAAHSAIAELGGMLVFDRADAATDTALRRADLHVAPTR